MMSPCEYHDYTAEWIPVIAGRVLEQPFADFPFFVTRARLDLERRTEAWLRLRDRWVEMLPLMPASHAVRLERCIAWRDNELAHLALALGHLGAAVADGSTSRAHQAAQTCARSHQCWEAFLIELRALAHDVEDVTALVYGVARPASEMALAA